MRKIAVKTGSRFEMIDITNQVRKIVNEREIKSGICHIFTPHTTAAITINENADPNVPRDIIMELDKVIPLNDNYRHIEGNSAAHIKSSLIGASEMVLIEDGKLILGTWQSIFFCEFDGPRTRKVLIKLFSTE
ncbi:MAG: secondary thiamine-phosphate synthase enzyme YjbQ [Syntrophales bacterium]|nr:secondary thiamine-phosphate synthase enzyme YjbQ [Syntrophales bacterium]